MTKEQTINMLLPAIQDDLGDAYDTGFAAGVESVKLQSYDEERIDLVVETIVMRDCISLMDAMKFHRLVRETLKELGFGPPPTLEEAT